MRRKLFTIWGLVLLRGLIEAALPALYFLPAFHGLEAMTRYVALCGLAGGALELVMVILLWQHPFRRILRLICLADLVFGGYLLWAYPVTLALLLVATGIWIAVRAFAVLWLGLSIVQRPLDRAIPVGAGAVGVLLGAAAMLWMPVEASLYLTLVSAYGLAAALVHVGVAFRMRADRARFLRDTAQEA